MTFNLTYNPDYADRNSLAFKTTADMIETEMLTVLQARPETSSSDINGVEVTAMRNGSVVADLIVSSGSPSFQAPDLQEAINNAITEGNFSTISAIGSVEVYGRFFNFNILLKVSSVSSFSLSNGILGH